MLDLPRLHDNATHVLNGVSCPDRSLARSTMLYSVVCAWERSLVNVNAGDGELLSGD